MAGREVVFDSLESEPVSVSHKGVYTTVETNRLAQIWRNIYWLHLPLVKIESFDANKTAMRSQL